MNATCVRTKHARSLQVAVDVIKEVSSDINFDDWDCLKRASSLKMMICFPKET